MGSYPYLVLSTAFLGLFITSVACRPRLRRLILLSAMLWTPSAVFAFTFVPAYWDPVLVIPARPGLEDLTFSFGAAGVCLAVAGGRHARLVVKAPPWSCQARRLTFVMATFLAVFAVVRPHVPGVMTQALLATVPLGGLMAWLRPDAWSLALRGLMGFPPIYLLATWLVGFAWPEFGLQWSGSHLWGPRLWGIPIEEAAWALAYGALCPWITVYVLGVQTTALPASGVADTDRSAAAPMRSS